MAQPAHFWLITARISGFMTPGAVVFAMAGNVFNYCVLSNREKHELEMDIIVMRAIATNGDAATAEERAANFSSERARAEVVRWANQLVDIAS
jgi:hypothetical protein